MDRTAHDQQALALRSALEQAGFQFIAAPQLGNGVLSLEAMRRLSDRELLAYAEAHDDDAAWDEVSERGAERQFEG